MKTQFTRSLIFASLLLLWPSSGFALSPEAKMHFNAGVAYVDDPSGAKWEEALKEFRAAYAMDPNWKLMNNIGLCALYLERDGEAIEAFRQYLNHGGEPDFTEKQRKQMESDIATLGASLVRVNVEVEPPDAILIDERRNSKGILVVNQYPVQFGRASLGIHPGLHKITIQAPGFTNADWSFSADPSSTHVHQFKLVAESKAPLNGTPVAKPAVLSETAAPTSFERRTPTSVYVGLAATGVFAVAATITGFVALDKQKDFDNATDPGEMDRLSKSGKTWAWTSNVMIGGAVLSAAATAYFYFTAPTIKTSKSGAPASLRMSPVIGSNTSGIAVDGKF